MAPSRDEWVKRVERWRDSGLTAKEFAAELGINAGTLAQWKHRLAKEKREGKAEQSRRMLAPRAASERPAPPISTALATPLPLIEVQLSALPGEWFELELVDGRRLRIPPSFDDQPLRRLLRVLQETA